MYHRSMDKHGKIENPDALFAELVDAIEWEQRQITIFGKTHDLPRLTAYYGVDDYTYSGIENKAGDMPRCLEDICAYIEQALGFKADNVLCNYYRDGQDTVGWHNDAEPGVGETIVSISFGGSRKFSTRTGGVVENHILTHGDVVSFPSTLDHTIRRSKTLTEPRINITLRKGA